MKMEYIKPVCEIQNIVSTSILAASGVHGDGAGSDIGYGGEGSSSDDPDVKGQADWDIWD